ncbi:MAG TPA: hypothetical protein VEQ58_19675, partial [Polyangiaceae bacterium]|nr:hypothetical protein [Polyangiaceae bacterium]
MHDAERQSAERFRRLIGEGHATPALLRKALSRLAPGADDAWLDFVLELEPALEDGPELPRGCVPYLPCATRALLQ